jgi:hypothetical protein|tara:strand:+ start:180 stop:809 length:630 start_codon:yes stop_codon:yes gene_type:complete
MIRTNNKNINYFLNYVKEDIGDYGVKLYLPKHTYLLDEGIKVNGYFSEEDLVLAVATKKQRKKWLGTLAHEYSHFEQWRDQADVWINSMVDGEDSEDIIFRWIKGEEFSSNLVKKCFEVAKELELDCERRAVKKIKKFDLPLDIEEYSRQSSAYIYYYNYVELKRMEYKPKKEVYYEPEILSAMPKTLRGKYKKIPKNIISLFDKFLSN